MNGIFGYDGYLYQTIVVSNLILDHLLSIGGLSSFILEAYHEDGSFSVDCIVINKDSKLSYFYEIKGGKFSIKKCIKKLEKCLDRFKKEKAITNNCSAELKVIYKNNNQITNKDIESYGSYLHPMSNNISVHSQSKPSFGSLESDTQEKCRQLVKLLVPEFDSDRQKRYIYLFLRHFIELRIQYMAEELRVGKKPSLQIILQEFLNSNDSFSEIMAELYKDRFSSKTDVFEKLVEKIEGEKDLQPDVKYGSGIFKNEKP